jgi:signal transduction histidine kinase
MIAAELSAAWARKVRFSVGLMIQTTMMALLGPAPAAFAGVLAMWVDWRVFRGKPESALLNMVIYGVLGLVGGLVFDAALASGLEREDTAYALLVLPVYAALMVINLILISLTHPGVSAAARRRIFRESGLPTIPIELLSGIMAAFAVLTWAHAGHIAVVGLLAVLVITVPLARTVGSSLTTDDDLLALREVSDRRAEEVARLSSDRDRLLSEVVDAEQRERARLAESLHDGPVQRLTAMRQDVAEGAPQDQLAGQLDAALAETRSIISAFHPVMAQELGFEASLRAAIAPFPAGQAVALTIESTLDDRLLARTLLLPLAQELLVNAVKHADPSAIHMSVHAHDGRVVLEVSDDGVGIDTAEAGRAVQAGHLGLAMVRRRVEDAGGVLDIETRPDGGTRSQVTLPRTVV